MRHGGLGTGGLVSQRTDDTPSICIYLLEGKGDLWLELRANMRLQNGGSFPFESRAVNVVAEYFPVHLAAQSTGTYIIIEKSCNTSGRELEICPITQIL